MSKDRCRYCQAEIESKRLDGLLKFRCGTIATEIGKGQLTDVFRSSFCKEVEKDRQITQLRSLLAEQEKEMVVAKEILEKCKTWSHRAAGHVNTHVMCNCWLCTFNDFGLMKQIEAFLKGETS